MEGGQVSYLGRHFDKADDQTDETAGLIPRAIDMIFTVSSQLRDRGWKYQMEGQFLEVYNEVVSFSIPSEIS
jgi:kinesin family protein C1